MESPLANRTYRRLFAAQVVALLGTGLSTVALSLLAAVVLLGRLALDLHPYEHPLEADGEIEICHVCVGGGSQSLPAAAWVPAAVPPPAASQGPGRRAGTFPLRPWTRPPSRGPPPLV